MNEHPDIQNQDEKEEVEIEEEKEKPEDSLENDKKLEEISTKKNQSFHMSQAKDSQMQESVWGNFKIRPSDSLEIVETEPIYRTPLTNIIESEIIYYLLVELPGLNKKNVEISLQENVLEILGDKKLVHKEKKEDKKEKDKKEKEKKDKDKKDKKKEKDKEIKGEYLRREYRAATFYRSFYLPENINLEDIEANFKNGILTLKIPKQTISSTEKQVIEIK